MTDPSTSVVRPVYLQEELNEDFLYKKPSTHCKLYFYFQFSLKLYFLFNFALNFFSDYKKLKNNLGNCSFVKVIQNLVPATKWMRRYRWKEDFLGDVLSGFTVAIMHIPQVNLLRVILFLILQFYILHFHLHFNTMYFLTQASIFAGFSSSSSLTFGPFTTENKSFASTFKLSTMSNLTFYGGTVTLLCAFQIYWIGE